MNYKVSAKRPDGKWFNFGTIKINKFGKPQLSMKNTGDLKDHILQGGEWLNFSLFEVEEKKTIAPETQVLLDDLKRDSLDAEIPF